MKRSWRWLTVLVGSKFRPGAGALTAGLLLLVVGCGEGIVTPGGSDPEGGRVCGATEGAFRDRWWNYYERALSYAGCAMWDAAESDLRAAIDRRSDDQRRARTYGMHFVDYFPHRELGIVLYRRGRLEAAMRELETSLAGEKSAKAELYLDRVRKEWIEKNRIDRLPPLVTIDSPVPGALVQGFSVSVKGTARDDTYVKRIEIDGIPVRIDLAARQIPFSVDVPVTRSDNRIRVVVTDLAGRVTRSSVQIHPDREGPVVGIDEARPGGRLRGYVEDRAGLAGVRINGTSLPLSPEGTLRLDYPLPSAVQAPMLEIEALDMAGNLTIAQLDFTEGLNRRQVPTVRLAAAGPVIGPVPATGDDELYVNYRTGAGEIFLDHIYLEGRVHMPEGVSTVTLDGIELVRRWGRTVFFTRRLALRPGDNPLRIEAVDTLGRVIARSITLTRTQRRLERRADRYRLALYVQPPAGAGYTAALWDAVIGERRFQPAGDGPLGAQDMGSDTSSPSGLVHLARGRQADGVLLVRVGHDADTLEYVAQLVDGASGKPVRVVDAYGEGWPDPSRLGIELLGRLRDGMPVLEGEVLGSDESGLRIDVSGVEALYEGQPLWLYRQASARRDPLTGADLGSDHRVLGRALMGSSLARPLGAVSEPGVGEVHRGDRVMTP